MNLFLLSDLDRTTLPNGHQQEASWARPLLRKLSQESGVKLAYVSGRDAGLVKKAIAEYALPVPDFVVADVGTSIYQVHDGQWQVMNLWTALISEAWQGKSRDDIYFFLKDIDSLTLQEPEKQGKFKLSFYLDAKADFAKYTHLVQDKLLPAKIKTSIICSIDESENIAFLDVLPQNATKLHAIYFLIKQTGFSLQNTVYAGDSGNDMPVLESEIPSVLVANASSEMKRQALLAAEKQGNLSSLYIVPPGISGNYSAGVIAGASSYMPQLKQWYDLNKE